MQIIRYNQLVIAIILIINLISCSKGSDKNYKLKKVKFHSKSEVVVIKKYSLYTEKWGSYLLIDDNAKRDKILKKMNIDKISLLTNDTAYYALPYDVLSSQLPTSTFSFALKNKSNKLQYYDDLKGELILIGNEDQLNLLK